MADEARAYGATARFLHWLTVLALGTRFTIGYVLDVDDSGRGHGGDGDDGSGHGRGHGRGDDSVLGDGWNLVATHVALGVLILVLAVTRVLRRGLVPRMI